MVLHRPLNYVLRSWTHIAVLRALRDTATGFSGNQVARASGMTPRSAFLALTALEILGLVRRQRGGREHLFTLNRSNQIVEHGIIPLLQVEVDLPERFGQELRRLLQRCVVSAVLFGSTVRGDETPGSDLDLCCIVQDEAKRDAVRTALGKSARRLRETYGVGIAPIYLTVAEARRKRSSALLKDIVSNGRLIAGKAIREVISG
jgi:predicted nucleotidyltransferase